MVTIIGRQSRDERETVCVCVLSERAHVRVMVSQARQGETTVIEFLFEEEEEEETLQTSFRERYCTSSCCRLLNVHSMLDKG